MKIISRIENSQGLNEVTLQTGDNKHSIAISPKAGGLGSSANGGELLFLALAACYCNDIYREAAKRGLTVERVAVEVQGDFPVEGQPARDIAYRATVVAHGTPEEIRDLMIHTDTVAEIQNTLRISNALEMTLEAIPAGGKT